MHQGHAMQHIAWHKCGPYRKMKTNPLSISLFVLQTKMAFVFIKMHISILMFLACNIFLKTNNNYA